MRIRLAAILGAIGALVLAFGQVAGTADAGVGVMRASGAPQYVPTWSWNAATTRAIPSGASFARASNRSCTSSSGVIVQLSSNVACFDYDPLTLASLGYRAEMQSTNNIAWSILQIHTNNTGAAPTTDGTVAPNGVDLASLITAGSGAGNHYINTTATAPGGTGKVVGHSVFVKQGSTRYVTIMDRSDAVEHFGTFDFTTGAWAGAGANATTEPPRQMLNGWWRLGFQATMTNNVSDLNIAPSITAPGTPAAWSYTAAGTETVYAWGAQVDTAGVGVTSLIVTAGAIATRAQDVLSMPLTSLPGWNASKGGVLVAAYQLHTRRSSGDQSLLNMQGTSDSANFNANQSGADRMRSLMDTGGDVGAGVSPPANFTRRKSALAWQLGRFTLSNDGGAPTVATNLTALPTGLATLYIGGHDGANGLQGALESIAYYAGTRSDAFAQQVSR